MRITIQRRSHTIQHLQIYCTSDFLTHRQEIRQTSRLSAMRTLIMINTPKRVSSHDGGVAIAIKKTRAGSPSPFPVLKEFMKFIIWNHQTNPRCMVASTNNATTMTSLRNAAPLVDVDDLRTYSYALVAPQGDQTKTLTNDPRSEKCKRSV